MNGILKRFSVVMICLLAAGCEKNYTAGVNEDFIKEALEKITLPAETDTDLSFPETIDYKNHRIFLLWETSNDSIGTDGKIKRDYEDLNVNVIVKGRLEDAEYRKDFGNIKVLRKEADINFIKEALEEITLPAETDTDLSFPKTLDYKNHRIFLLWKTSNDSIGTDGKIKRDYEDLNVNVIVMGRLEGAEYCKDFGNIKVLRKEADINFIKEALEKITLPAETRFDLHLPLKISYKGIDFNVKYSTDNPLMDSSGKVLLPSKEDELVLITAEISHNGLNASRVFTVKIRSCESILEEASGKFKLPNEINDDIELPSEFENVNIEWESLNPKVLTNKGKCFDVCEATEVTLIAGFNLTDKDGKYVFKDMEYMVTVKPYGLKKRFEEALKEIKIPSRITRNTELPIRLGHNLIGSWESDNEEVINGCGEVFNKTEDTDVTLTLKAYDPESGEVMTNVYKTVVAGTHETVAELDFYTHNIIERSDRIAEGKTKGLHFENGKIVLDDDKIEGIYESKIYKTLAFDEAVGSWSCITGKDFTCELEISVRTDNVWSNYFSYGKWGLGKKNLYYNQDDRFAKMNVDEIIIKDGTADALRFRITLRREDLTSSSPELSQVAIALRIKNYKYYVNTEDLPLMKDYDLPKLYQHDVPGIGRTICSATTTAMLLKWKGHNFKDCGYKYEHEYIASLVADPGHNSPTYGNWSYNMATAGAFGDNARVGRMYSWEEAMKHLAEKGPFGASIASPHGEFGYVSQGHLIVVRGYRIGENGKTTVICNDPNIKGVYYEVTLDMFMTCWRGVVYIVE